MMTEKQNTGNSRNGQNQPDGQNEIHSIAQKMGVSEDEVREAIAAVGLVRQNVEAYLTDKGGFNEQATTRQPE